jgi:hypothetical protein
MVTFFLAVALMASTISRVLSGAQNGVFYSKNLTNVTDPHIRLWRKNIHHLANEVHRTYMIRTFFFLMAILWDQTGWLWCISASLALTMLSSAAASYGWQKWINLGSGLPAVDPNERRDYELTFRGKSWWIPKFWYGERRRWISLAAVVAMFVILHALEL